MTQDRPNYAAPTEEYSYSTIGSSFLFSSIVRAFVTTEVILPQFAIIRKVLTPLSPAKAENIVTPQSPGARESVRPEAKMHRVNPQCVLEFI